MSEVILKAVAEAIASTEVKLEQQLQALNKRVTELPPIVSRDAIDALISEVKSMHQSLYEEVQEIRQTALNKTGFVEQELRKEVAKITGELQSKLDANVSELTDKVSSYAVSITEVHELVKSVREEFEGVNNDTLNLTAKGLESITDRVDFVESQLHSTISRSVKDLRNELQEQIKSVETKPGPEGTAGKDGKDGVDGAGIVLDYWEAGIHRQGSVVLHYLGQYFRAKCDTVSEPGTDDTWERLGSAGFRHRGGFDAEKTYEVGDMYVKDFATFTCIGTEHVLFAARGPVGPRGEKGQDSTVAGPAGRDGTTVSKVHTDESGFVLEMSDGTMHGVPFPKSIQELFKSPSDYLPVTKLKSIAATSTDFKSFQAALAKL